MTFKTAVVIGINYGNQKEGRTKTQSAIKPLSYAEADAYEIQTILEAAGYSVRNLYGARATQRAIINVIEEQAEAAGTDGTLVVYFAGHGEPDRESNTAYLIPVDADPRSLAATGVAMDKLVSTYVASAHTVLMLLDCCHSGHAVGLRSTTSDEGVAERGQLFLDQMREAFTLEKRPNRGRVVIAACPGNAKAREMSSLQHGLFTFHILEYWKTEPGEVDDLNLYRYVSRSIRQLSGTTPDPPPVPVRGGNQYGEIVLRGPQPSKTEASSNEVDKNPEVQRIITIEELLGDVVDDAADKGDSQPTAIPEYKRRAIEQQSRSRAALIDGLLKQFRNVSDTNNYPTIVEVGNRILALTREYPEVIDQTVRALVSLAQGSSNMDSSVTFMNEALRYSPQHSDLYHHRASFLVRQGKDKKAIEDWTEAIRLNGQVAAYYYNRAHCYFRLGQYPEAIDDFTSAAELSSSDGNIYLARGESFFQLGHMDAAKEDWIWALACGASKAAESLNEHFPDWK